LSAPPAPELDPATDPFAEGNEDHTPPEVYAVRPNGGAADTPGWTVRVVPNLYPALAASVPAEAMVDMTPEGEPAPRPGANASPGLRTRFRALCAGARARALRCLLDAHDGRQPAGRPRPGRSAKARADRRHR